jgi:hypothetical protein
MLKKIGLSVALLAGMVAFAPRPAKAEVHFGVYVGAPAYTYPAYPAYGYNTYPDYYAYPAAPVYPAPTYVAPYTYGYGSRYYRDRDRDHDRHERYERHDGDEHRFRR